MQPCTFRPTGASQTPWGSGHPLPRSALVHMGMCLQGLASLLSAGHLQLLAICWHRLTMAEGGRVQDQNATLRAVCPPRRPPPPPCFLACNRLMQSLAVKDASNSPGQSSHLQTAGSVPRFKLPPRLRLAVCCLTIAVVPKRHTPAQGQGWLLHSLAGSCSHCLHVTVVAVGGHDAQQGCKVGGGGRICRLLGHKVHLHRQ